MPLKTWIGSIMSLIVISLVISAAQGAETNNFSFAKDKRDKRPNSFNLDLTNITNLSINEYIHKLSSTVKNCLDRQEVMAKTKFIFDTNFPDISQDLYRKSSPTDRLKFLISQHGDNAPLYKGFKPPSYSGCCAPVVLTGGIAVGTDKIDHFLSSGFLYYKEYSEKKQIQVDIYGKQEEVVVLRTDSDEQRTKDAIKLGKFQEESSWGLSGTGVKAYGDLAANYAGLQFYKNLFEGENPYLKCIDGRFVVQRTFKVEDYIDDSWDESINCSSFNSEENRDIVIKNMKAMGFEKCPIDPKKCEVLVKKYGALKNDILHPLCVDSASNHNQVETALSNVKYFMKIIEFIEPKDIEKARKGVK
jgi:hypothetical protein